MWDSQIVSHLALIIPLTDWKSHVIMIGMNELETKFRDVYEVNHVNNGLLHTLVLKYGAKQVFYTLKILKKSPIREWDLIRPYEHLDLVCGRMSNKYKVKAKLAPGTTMNFSSKRKRVRRFG